MDAATRTELLAGVERIRGHALQLLVEAEDLKRKLDGDPPPDSGGSGPVGGGGGGVSEFRIDDFKVTQGRVMAVRGQESFTSLALDPHIQVKLFHPEDPSARLRPVVEIADLEQMSDLPASLRMFGDAPLAAPLIVAPGTTDAVEAAVRGALEGEDDLAAVEIRFLGLGED